jgi:hypothetical protein
MPCRILCAADMFAAIDRDSSGEIDIDEFEKGIRRLGLGLTPQQLEWLLETMDADGNGQIDLVFLEMSRHFDWEMWKITPGLFAISLGPLSLETICFAFVALRRSSSRVCRADES